MLKTILRPLLALVVSYGIVFSPVAPALAAASQDAIGYYSTSCGNAAPPCFIQYGATVPVSGSLTPSGTQDVNQKQVNGATINVGPGASDTGTQRITTSTDSTIGTVTSVTAITSITNPVGIKGGDGSTINAIGNATYVQPGTNANFKVNFDQTTPGTTNNVTLDGTQDNTTFSPAGVTSATTIITWTSVQLQGVGEIQFQFTGVGTTNTFLLEASNDGSTWAAVPVRVSTSSMTTAPSLATGIMYTAFVTGTQMRIRVATYTSGTVTVVGALRRIPSPDSGYLFIGGPSPSGQAPIGAPVGIGGIVTTAGVNCATTTRCNAQSAENGALLNRPFAVGALAWQSTVTLSDNTNTLVHASCGAGLKNYVVSLDWSSLVTTVADEVDLNDNTTPVWKNQIGAGASGRSFMWEIPKAGTAATAMNVALTGSPTGAVTVNVSGFCAP